jgi:hypothetical protein
MERGGWPLGTNGTRGGASSHALDARLTIRAPPRPRADATGSEGACTTCAMRFAR